MANQWFLLRHNNYKCSSCWNSFSLTLIICFEKRMRWHFQSFSFYYELISLLTKDFLSLFFTRSLHYFFFLVLSLSHTNCSSHIRPFCSCSYSCFVKKLINDDNGTFYSPHPMLMHIKIEKERIKSKKSVMKTVSGWSNDCRCVNFDISYI